MKTDYYVKAATKLFLSLKSPFGHDARTREEDIKLIADALRDAGGGGGRRIQQDGNPAHEIAHNLLLAHTGSEGGSPTINWYGLRAEIADAIAVAPDKQRRLDKCAGGIAAYGKAVA